MEGFTVSRPADEARERVLTFARAVSERIASTASIRAADVIVHDGFIGAGYGVPTPEGMAAIRLAAQCEGIFLDPTYTGKALAGLIAHIRAGRLERSAERLSAERRTAPLPDALDRASVG